MYTGLPGGALLASAPIVFDEAAGAPPAAAGNVVSRQGSTRSYRGRSPL